MWYIFRYSFLCDIYFARNNDVERMKDVLWKQEVVLENLFTKGEKFIKKNNMRFLPIVVECVLYIYLFYQIINLFKLNSESRNYH